METKTCQQIEDMAELQFSVEETAIIVDVSASDLASDSDASRAFMRGRLRAQAEVRAAILQQAKQGSTPAQKEFQKLADESRPIVQDDASEE